LLLQMKSTLSGEEETKTSDEDIKKAQRLFADTIKLLKAIGQRIVDNFSINVNGKETLNSFVLPDINFFVTQTISWLILLLHVWLKVTPAGKKKKAPELLVTELKNFTKEITTELKNVCSELATVLSSPIATSIDLTIFLDTSRSTIEFVKAEENSKLRSKVLANISASQKSSLEHILAIVNAKLNVIKALRA